MSIVIDPKSVVKGATIRVTTAIVWALSALAVLMPFHIKAEPVERTPHTFEKLTLAVLPTGPGGERLALFEALVLEPLSGRDNLQLVERVEIKRVLDELDLVEMSHDESENVLRLGELTGAGALLFISDAGSAASPACRVVLTETQAGMRLLDAKIDITDMQRGVSQILTMLDLSLQKLTDLKSTPAVCIGMLGIYSEAPGNVLRRLSTDLTAEFERALTCDPEFMLLERTNLRKLAEENELTGIEQSFRNSTVLIEGGVQMVGKQGLVVTLRLIFLADASRTALTADGTRDNLPGLRDELLRATHAAITGRQRLSMKPAETDLNRKDEAERLAERAGWLASRRLEGSCELAEASLALAFSPSAAVMVRGALAAKGDDLSNMLRANELDRNIVERFAAENVPASRYGNPGLECSRLVPRAPRNDQEIRIVARIRAVACDKFNLLRDWTRDDKQNFHEVLGAHLDSAGFLATTSLQYDELVREDVELFEKQILAFYKTDQAPSRGHSFAYYYALERIAKNGNPVKRTALYEWLSHRRDLETRLFGYYGLARCEDPQRRHAACIELVELSREGQWFAFHVYRVSDAARVIGKDEAYFTHMLDRARKLNDPAYLEDHAQLLNQLIIQHQGLSRQRAEAAWQVLDTLQGSADSAPYIRSLLDDYTGKRPAARSTAQEDDNPWDRYDIVPLKVANPLENGKIFWVHTPEQRTQVRTNEAIIVWKNDDRRVLFTRFDVKNGVLTSLATYDGRERPLSNPSCAAGNADRFYFGCSQGLVVVSNGVAKLFDTRTVLPITNLDHISLLGGKIYMCDSGMQRSSDRGAIIEFDPETEVFRVVASSRTLDARHDLEGGSTYRVCDILADEQEQCLWFAVSHDSTRRGLWRYLPGTDKFEHIIKYNVSEVHWNSGRLMVFNGHSVHMYDAEAITASPSMLPRRGYFQDLLLFTKRYAILDDLRFQNGYLYDLNSGKRHSPRRGSAHWDFVQRCGDDAIAATSDSLWLIQRKP